MKLPDDFGAREGDWISPSSLMRGFIEEGVYLFMPAITLWMAFALFILLGVRELLSYEYFLYGPLIIAWISITWVMSLPVSDNSILQGHSLWVFLLLFCGIMPVLYTIRRWYKQPTKASCLYMILAWDALGVIVSLYWCKYL